ncbi:hypothetical protein SETIT_8G138000v2 [Setaria italica]|uniref:RING-type domain-containing protein n=1 Tax=Setaria italica TaxID=4555 RepID=A0A368S7L3_SETIT|nr:hypothetical protein SETIT_8G138000v2 [Setaria italica]
MARQAIKMTVSAGEPAVAAPPPVPVAAGGDVLGSGGGVAIGPPPSEHEREEEDTVVGADDGLTDVDFSDEEDDDHDDTDDEDVDSDSEFEDEEGEAAAPGVVLLATSVFLGRLTPSASVQNTTGFMRLAAAEAAPGENGGGGGEIFVHYRYTRFSRAQSGSDGVDMHFLGPKLARVRFHLPSHHPAASGPVSTLLSLRLAGATLAAPLYPARFSAQLRGLWTGLIAKARVPPEAARLVVAVDVGILRPGDRTPERMRSMRAALESVARERDGAHPAVFDVGTELRLPAPLVSEDDVLEKGLAAWPRCSHIFHGRCLEEHLFRGSQECPMCRSRLQVDARTDE